MVRPAVAAAKRGLTCRAARSNLARTTTPDPEP